MISVVIPTYEQHGMGASYLEVLLFSLMKQSEPCEIVISDNSKDDKILGLVDDWNRNKTNKIKYVHNPIIGISANFNNAIAHASFDKIKPMCQDDKFGSPLALQFFSKAIDTHKWAVSNSSFIDEQGRVKSYNTAQWNPNLLKGVNSIGMPSVVAFNRNEFTLDPNLTTLADCEYYWLLMQKYGPPCYLKGFMISQRLHKLSASNQMPNRKIEDYQYLTTKHNL